MGGSTRAQTGEDMPNPEHETRTVVFTFADIIIARFRAGAEVMLADARDNVAAVSTPARTPSNCWRPEAFSAA